MTDKIVRIGCASGFWGDTSVAAPQLLATGNLDYLVFDYLAEITMSILAGARAKNADMGYATDFVTVTMASIIRDVAAQRVKVVSNAGGVNPEACAAAIRKLADEAGVDLTVAIVQGDDLMSRAGALRDSGVKEWQSGEPIPPMVMSINAYLGAFPIAGALADGADIVVTGRCVDSAVTLGPLIHEFGWATDDWDRLSAGTLAGHIIECGAQATGGIFTDWDRVPDWDEIGFPIVECAADGSFTVTKPDGTGGLVSPATVGEQMLYEIGDPRAYVVPDVVCDFTAVTMEAVGDDRVRVAGARGRPAPAVYKVSATYLDGFRCIALAGLVGRDAPAKARRIADAILARTRKIFQQRNWGDYDDVAIDVLGTESEYGSHSRAPDAREVILRIAVRHHDKAALATFAREIAPAGTGMAPGLSGFAGGRPKVQPVVRLYSFLIAKSDVPVTVALNGEAKSVDIAAGEPFDPAALGASAPGETASVDGGTATVPLADLAWARSGDKGDSANVGVIARKPDYLPYIRAALSERAVADYFAHLVEGPVTRYEVPGIHALNFLLDRALGGGGIASLRNDPQGKAYGQILLDYPVQIPEGLVA